MRASTVLSRDDLARLSAPSVDQRGVRFEYEGRILRAIPGEYADFYRVLLESPKLEGLFEQGLVRFWLTDIAVEGFEMVIECERVPIVSYPQEWPTALLVEAALFIARLGTALTGAGVGLQDAHPWNVLFNGPRPVWIDIGSLVPAGRVSDGWIDEYRRHIVLPLALRAMRWHEMADAVWLDHPGFGVKRIWDRRLVRRLFPLGFSALARGSRDPRDFYPRLQAYVERLHPTPGYGEWSGYVQSPGAIVGDVSTYGPKQLAVDYFLSGARQGTVLDAGANVGWFTDLAVSHGHRVVALDMDDRSLGRIFARSRSGGTWILPLRVDIMWPLGSHGVGLSHAAAPGRLRCDTTLWLAVVHHLAGRQGYPFGAIARAIDMYTRDRAIVEFIPRDDAHLRDWPRAHEPWWDVDEFIQAMRPFFPSVELRQSAPAPRIMLCFTRRGP